jgi:hypothetical protein
LELGYFFAKIGRKHICCLYKSGVEIPSDISGVIYKEFIKSVKEKYRLASSAFEVLGETSDGLSCLTFLLSLIWTSTHSLHIHPLLTYFPLFSCPCSSTPASMTVHGRPVILTESYFVELKGPISQDNFAVSSFVPSLIMWDFSV